MAFKLKDALESPGGLVKPQIAGTTSRIPDFSRSGKGCKDLHF